MIILQCSECKSICTTIDDKYNIKCLNCGIGSSNVGYFDIYESLDDSIIKLSNEYWISRKGENTSFTK